MSRRNPNASATRRGIVYAVAVALPGFVVAFASGYGFAAAVDALRYDLATLAAAVCVWSVVVTSYAGAAAYVAGVGYVAGSRR